MTTRSIVIAVGTAATPFGIQTLKSPPAGWCYIVKTVTVMNTTGTAQPVSVGLNRPGIALIWLFTQTLQASTSGSVSTWHIVNPTDQVVWNPAVAGVYCWISGTILPLSPIS